MIVMDLKIDNFISFKNFHMNMSYPKKIVDSYIENEFLKERTNFRYKKINIIMGANATGKTSIGKMLMMIFNFLDKKKYEDLTDAIFDQNKEAAFSVDYVTDNYVLYRVRTIIRPKQNRKYQMEDIDVTVNSVAIGTRDNYETCTKKLEEKSEPKADNYIEELEKIRGLSWMFEYPFDSIKDDRRIHIGKNDKRYLQIATDILKTLDPAIDKIERSEEIEDTYIIRYAKGSVIIQDGKLMNGSILSSGTKAGLEIAGMLTSILEAEFGFYYCDEKFSYIHSDIEKAILSVMVSGIRDNEQLFFTTHNTDILDLPLPKHSFVFLKKDMNDQDEPIKCISASTILKRNTDCLKNAVENDLFSVAPNIERIYELLDAE